MALPFGELWYLEVDHAIGYAKHYSRSHDAVIRVYDAAGNVIETHEHAGFSKSRQFTFSLRCGAATVNPSFGGSDVGRTEEREF